MDSDRMIIAEPSENIFMGDIPTVYTPIYQYIKDKEYTITSYNFCEDSYVYAGMNATPGQHIDHNNQGVQIPSYPATVYFVRNALNKEKDLTIDGFLPAGTKLEVYLSNSDGNGDFLVLGDGQELYREALTSQDYNAGYPISSVYYYSTSDKKISVTLEQDVQELKLCVGEGLYHVVLSGIDVTLPEKYAVDRWYHATQYDVFLGNAETAGPYKKRTSRIMICPNEHEMGERVTVREDVTYISDQIWTEANADTIAQRAQEIQKISGNCVIRIEDAGFSGTTWASMEAYYTDFYEMCTANGFGWLSNDWMNLCFPHWQQQYIAEAPGYIQYKGYDSFHIELLKLLQKYQSSR